MDIVTRDFISFEWDENKRLINIQKHGIDFPRAARALSQPHLESRSDQNGESHSGDMPGNRRSDRNYLYDAGRYLPDHISAGDEEK